MSKSDKGDIVFLSILFLAVVVGLSFLYSGIFEENLINNLEQIPDKYELSEVGF